MNPRTHRKNGTFRAGNRAAAVPDHARRVILPAQRLAPETLARLIALGAELGGIGRAIDAAVAAYRPPARPPA